MDGNGKRHNKAAHWANTWEKIATFLLFKKNKTKLKVLVCLYYMHTLPVSICFSAQKLYTQKRVKLMYLILSEHFNLYSFNVKFVFPECNKEIRSDPISELLSKYHTIENPVLLNTVDVKRKRCTKVGSWLHARRV